MAEELNDFIEASGLLTYDPVAIDSIYKKNPIRLLRRLWQTLLPIGLFLLGVGWEKLIGSLEKDERKHTTVFYRIWNEVPTCIMVIIVLLIIIKPF